MFGNEIRINHLRLLYLYLLKYRWEVWNVAKEGQSYIVTLAKRDGNNELFPIHDSVFVLSPLPEG